MFKRILVGVDFRPGGRDAVALASRFLDPDGTMTLVHVYPGVDSPTEAIDPALAAADRERAVAQLEEERAAAPAEAEALLTEGAPPGRRLHEEAESRGADLLVVGSCHRGVFGRVMLGSDTLSSLNGAPCAVAIAPQGYVA